MGMMQDYQGRIALVTGAFSGIGAGIAAELARRGRQVLLVARRVDRLELLAATIRDSGAEAVCLPCDITDEPAVKALAAEVKSQFAQIDLLVNNAGREMLAPLQVTKSADARDLMEINLLAVSTVTCALLNLLTRGAAIVNMASTAALRGEAGMAMYCASKGAVVAWTRALALELAPRGIRVNAVAPGMVKTDLMERNWKKLRPEHVKALEAQHPLGFGTVEDVAAATAFLGSDAARWITGHTLVVDGGLTA